MLEAIFQALYVIFAFRKNKNENLWEENKWSVAVKKIFEINTAEKRYSLLAILTIRRH